MFQPENVRAADAELSLSSLKTLDQYNKILFAGLVKKVANIICSFSNRSIRIWFEITYLAYSQFHLT